MAEAMGEAAERASRPPGGPTARLMPRTALYLLGTLLFSRLAFKRLAADPDRFALAVRAVLVTGALYALRALAFAAAGAVPLAPGFPGISASNYFAWEILFAMPVFLAAWAAAATVFKLARRGAAAAVGPPPIAGGSVTASSVQDDPDPRADSSDVSGLSDEAGAVAAPGSRPAGRPSAAPAAEPSAAVPAASFEPAWPAAGGSPPAVLTDEALGSEAESTGAVRGETTAAAFALAAAAGIAWLPGAVMAIALLLGGSQAAWAEALSGAGFRQFFFFLTHGLALGVGLRLAVIIAGRGRGPRLRAVAIALAACVAAIVPPALFIR